VAELLIDNFQFLDKKTAATDLPINAAQKSVNLTPVRQPGKMVKIGNYLNDLTPLIGQSTLGSDITAIKSFKEVPLTRPEARDVFIFHGADGVQEDHLYVGPNYNRDTATFDNGLSKITDKVGKFTTVDAGTNASQIVILAANPNFGLYSDTNDTYNRWYVTYNLGPGGSVGSVVLDYTVVVGVSKTFTFITGGLSPSSGTGNFMLGRYPAHGNRDIGPTLAGLTVSESMIRFINRENLSIGGTGTGSQFPGQIAVWYGWIDREFGSTLAAGTGPTFDDFWFDTQQMLMPFVDNAPPPPFRSAINVTLAPPSGTATANVANGDWQVFIAYQYDGFQVGPLSEPFNINKSGAINALVIQMQLGFESNFETVSAEYLIAFDTNPTPLTPTKIPNEYNPYIISRRITGVYLFAKAPGSNAIVFIDTLNTTTTTPDRNPSSVSGFEKKDGDFTHLANGTLGRIVEMVDDPISTVTYSEFVGATGVRPNFKYGLSVDDRFVAANIINEDGEPTANHLIASTVTAEGAPSHDNLALVNELNLGIYGSKEITGVALVSDSGQTTSPKRRIMVFTDDDLYTMQLVTTGSAVSYSTDRFGTQEGCIAPEAITQAEGKLFYISRTGFRAIVVGQSVPIGEGLRDDFNNLTAPELGVAGYLKRERMVIFHFPADGKTYFVDLTNNKFNMFEMDFEDQMLVLVPTRIGELLGTNSVEIFTLMKGDKQAGDIALAPILRTKTITSLDVRPGAISKELVLREFVIRYRCDTNMSVSFFLNGVLLTSWVGGTLVLPEAPVETEKRFYFPIGARGETLEIEFFLNEFNGFDNTIFEVNSIKLDLELENKRR